jgi:hypothetical protein
LGDKMTGNKFHKDKLFAKVSHTATSGVVGDAEYEVLGEIKLSVATDFTTSGTLTVQGRIKHSSSWQTIGTLTSGGDFDTFDIDAYDFIRFNFTVTAGSTGEIAASGFFKAAASGGATNTFATIQTDAGTNPVADSATDTLTLTSSDSFITITGNSTTDTVDLTMPSQILLNSGSQAAPSLSFTGDVDTGIYSSGSNQFRLVAGNTSIARISTSSFTQYKPSYQANGTVSLPSFSFTGMTNGGIYRDSGSNELRMSIEADDKMTWAETKVSVFEPLQLSQYTTAGLPTASSFEGCIVYDTDTNTIKWSNGTSWATI